MTRTGWPRSTTCCCRIVFAEAIAEFKSIDRDRMSHTQLQYDYCAAYLSMTHGDTEQARAIVEQYEDHPSIAGGMPSPSCENHLDEIDGKDVAVGRRRGPQPGAR